MLTVLEYLDLYDIDPHRMARFGKFENYFWVSYKFAVDPLSAIKPSQPFWLIGTLFDGSTPAWMFYDGPQHFCQSKEPWEKIDEDFIISPPLHKAPNLGLGADFGLIGITERPSNLELSRILNGFEDRDGLISPPDQIDLDEFWRPLKELNAYFYCSYLNRYLFLARDAELYEQIFRYERLVEPGFSSLYQEYKRRNELWQEIGPEDGPNKCIEKECKRKSIRNGRKCFFHEIGVDDSARIWTSNIDFSY